MLKTTDGDNPTYISDIDVLLGSHVGLGGKIYVSKAKNYKYIAEKWTRLGIVYTASPGHTLDRLSGPKRIAPDKEYVNSLSAEGFNGNIIARKPRNTP